MISYFGSRTEKGFISALIEDPDSFPVSSDHQLPAIDFGNGAPSCFDSSPLPAAVF